MSTLYRFPTESHPGRGVEAEVYSAGAIDLHPYHRGPGGTELSSIELDLAEPGDLRLSCSRLPWEASPGSLPEALTTALDWCGRILDIGSAEAELWALREFLERVLKLEPTAKRAEEKDADGDDDDDQDGSDRPPLARAVRQVLEQGDDLAASATAANTATEDAPAKPQAAGPTGKLRIKRKGPRRQDQLLNRLNRACAQRGLLQTRLHRDRVRRIYSKLREEGEE